MRFNVRNRLKFCKISGKDRMCTKMEKSGYREFDHSVTLKGHSQLAHMRVRYHFIANLHITETRYIPILTKNDKNNIGG